MVERQLPKLDTRVRFSSPAPRPAFPCVGSADMKLSEDEVRIPSPDGEIRSVVIRPVGGGRWPAVLSTATSSSSPSPRCAPRGGWRRSGSRSSRRRSIRATWRGRPGVRRRGQGRPAWPGPRDHDGAVRRRPGRVLDLPRRGGDVGEVYCVGLLHRRAPRVPGRVRRAGGGDGLLLPDRPARREARRRRGQRDAGPGGRRRRPDDGRLRNAGPARPGRRAAADPAALYAAGAEDLELHVYAGGEHAFMRDIGPRHDPDITDAALAEAVSFLNRR